MSKILSVTMFFVMIFFVNISSTQANECKIKLVPKMDILIFVIGYRTKWQNVEKIEKYSDCISYAEKLLEKANGPADAGTLGEIIELVVSSIFLPDYFKAIKVKFKDESGQTSRAKIKYTKNIKTSNNYKD